MTVHRYYCIVCGFVVQTLQKWTGSFFECPSCHKYVELRILPSIEEGVPERDPNSPEMRPN